MRDFCPFRQATPFSQILNNDIVASVTALLFSRCPTAVRRFVVAVIVDAVDGQIVPVAVGHGPGVEIAKHIPFRAYADAARAIILPIRGLWIGAALLHAFPNVIDAGFGQAEIGNDVVLIAAAAFDTASAQLVPANGCDVPTIAAAKPIGPVPFVPLRRLAHDGQPPKALACKVVILAQNKTSIRSLRG